MGRNTNPDYQQLIATIETGNHKHLEKLLSKGLDPNDRKPQKLVSEGYNIMDTWVPPKYTAPGPRPLDVALKVEDAIAVALLLEHGARCDEMEKVTAFREHLQNKKFFSKLLRDHRELVRN